MHMGCERRESIQNHTLRLPVRVCLRCFTIVCVYCVFVCVYSVVIRLLNLADTMAMYVVSLYA